MWAGVAVGLAAVAGVYLWWGIRHLPAARWQFAAAFPVRPLGEGGWEGRNLTWYGLLAATAYVAGAALFVFLAGAAGFAARESGLLGIGLLVVGVPASKLVNVWVEKKREGFTVGGAVFAATLAAPWLILAGRRWAGLGGDAGALLAALAIAYALGEGLGRLACLSFGCCYGRPIGAMPSAWRWCRLVFHGATKKIAYQGGLEGQPVFAVQAVTAVLYTATAAVAVALFGAGHHLAAGLLALGVTTIWRAASEPLRRDHHEKKGYAAAYGAMALGTLVYGAVCLWLFSGSGRMPDLAAGWRAVAAPAVWVAMAALWVGITVRMGLSEVTGSRILFRMRRPAACAKDPESGRDEPVKPVGLDLHGQVGQHGPVVLPL